MAEPQAKDENQEEGKEQVEAEAGNAETPAKVVTVSQTVSTVDNVEREKLTAEIARLKDELEKSNREAAKSKDEGDKEHKEKILKLEEELSLLGKEKSRYEQQATDSKQVSELMFTYFLTNSHTRSLLKLDVNLLDIRV